MAQGLATDRWKLNLDDYVRNAISLSVSMDVNGFLAGNAVPIDPSGELLDGSHRVACALAHGIKTIPVEHKRQRVWAPAWDADWFLEKGMRQEHVGELVTIYERLKHA